MGRNKMLLNKVTIYHSGLSFSFVCMVLSDTCSLESFFIFGCFSGPLSTIGLHCTVECDNTTCVACMDPFIVPYTLSSCDVRRCGFTSSSEDSLSDK